MLPYWILFAMFAAGAIVVRESPGGSSQSRPLLYFAAILMTGTNSEGVNETGLIPTSDLPSSGALFWRPWNFQNLSSTP